MFIVLGLAVSEVGYTIRNEVAVPIRASARVCAIANTHEFSLSAVGQAIDMHLVGVRLVNHYLDFTIVKSMRRKPL